MIRPFHPSDNLKRFSYRNLYGTLEFPLHDPGSARPDEGIFWRDNGGGWDYVLPIDVDPIGWVAEGTPSERHTPGQPTLTPFVD
jgi:hypothetical protein